MSRYVFDKLDDFLYKRLKKLSPWNAFELYRRPRSFTPIVTVYVCAFYTGVIGAAIHEQLYKEKYWEEHPGELVPLMLPVFYDGPWRVYRGEVPVLNKPPQ